MYLKNILTSFAAITPWEAWEVHEGLEDIEDRPRDDNDVVHVLQEHHHEGGVSNTLGIKFVTPVRLNVSFSGLLP